MIAPSRNMASEDVERHDVVIIGGGPAGLAAAAELKRLGIGDVVVIEREQHAGGVPRHCGHFGFGWREMDIVDADVRDRVDRLHHILVLQVCIFT